MNPPIFLSSIVMDTFKEEHFGLAYVAFFRLWIRITPFYRLIWTQAIFWSLLCLTCLAMCSVGSLYARIKTQVPTLVYEALTSVAVPTSAAHPKHYRHLFKHSLSQNAVIQLDFVEFWKNISYGLIELRDKTILGELFVERICVFGQEISIHFDWTWKLGVLRRVVSSYFSFRLQRVSRTGLTPIPNLGDSRVRSSF